jgi:glycosyltransferase involved in cell wall biosynthesis
MINKSDTINKPQKIVLIYQHDCHPVIKTFANSVTNESYSIKKLPLHSISGILYSLYLAITIPKYDIYFTDSAMSNFVPIFKRWLGEKNIIIYRGGDGIFGEKSDAYLYTKNKFKKKILLYILKNIDGVITESEMSRNDAKQWVDCPIELGVSYIEDIKSLSKIKPRLDTKKFLFIGDFRPPYDHKGIEILIETFNLLPDKYELYIIGKNTEHLKNKVKTSNIHVEGRVKDLKDYFKKCTYYIHAAKYETGPITILEAMSAGVIPIISKNCGHKEVVKKVSEKLILNSIEPKKIAEQILRLDKINIQKLDLYSKKAKKIINFKYSKKNQTKIFKENFYKLIKEINNIRRQK